MPNRQNENQHITKIPVARSKNNVLRNIMNVEHNIETPRTSKGYGKPIVGRMLISPSKEKRPTTFGSTQIVTTFTTIQWSLAPPITNGIPKHSSPFIFRGSDMADDPAVHFKRYKHDSVSSMDRSHKGRNDKIQPAKKAMSETRVEQHRMMYKRKLTKNNSHEPLRGVRLNRRFDLQMKFREESADNVKLDDNLTNNRGFEKFTR